MRDAAKAFATTPDTHADDARLLHQVAQQDRDAFVALYDRYAGQVYGVASKILEDRAASEDVACEAFLRLWQQADQVDAGQCSVKDWLLAVAHRRAIDALRRRRARRLLDPNVAHDGASAEHPAGDVDAQDAYYLDEYVSESDGAHEATHVNIPRQRVRQAISGLPEASRRVIELAFFSGLTHYEIAERLGEPLSAVHSRARQAMALLRQKLPELGSELGADE